MKKHPTELLRCTSQLQPGSTNQYFPSCNNNKAHCRQLLLLLLLLAHTISCSRYQLLISSLPYRTLQDLLPMSCTINPKKNVNSS